MATWEVDAKGVTDIEVSSAEAHWTRGEAGSKIRLSVEGSQSDWHVASKRGLVIIRPKSARASGGGTHNSITGGTQHGAVIQSRSMGSIEFSGNKITRIGNSSQMTITLVVPPGIEVHNEP